MKQDAHYYAVLAFCRACGFYKSSAQEIAFASQYVDDARVNHIKLDSPPPPEINTREISECPSFFNMATCHHYDRAETYNIEAMLYNTCAFHFPPGVEGNSFAQRMRCVQGDRSKLLKRIRKDVLSEDRITLGVFLHVYADSYAHQGFSGLPSKVNRVHELKRRGNWYNPKNWRPGAVFRSVSRRAGSDKLDQLIDRFLPAYGHLQAADFPDVPCALWEYKFDESAELSIEWKSPPEVVDNRRRYQEAFQGMEKILKEYLDRHPEDHDPNAPECDFDELFGILTSERETRYTRIRAWKKFLRNDLFDKNDKALKYDKNRWLRESFTNFEKRKFNKRKIDCGVLSSDFASSAWYRFYLAVDWYKKRLVFHCKDLGLDIPGSTVQPSISS